MLNSYEDKFYDGVLCLVGEKPLLNGQFKDKSLRKWTLCFCKEKSIYTTVNGLKKFSPIYLATQATSENPKPFYVVEKDGQFMTTQGYPVIYVGKVLDDYGFKDGADRFLELFNNKKKVYGVFFEKILVPAVGSGIPASEMPKAQRAFSNIQAKENKEPEQNKHSDGQTL